MFRFIIIAIVCTGMLIPIAGYSSNIVNKTSAFLIAISLGYVCLPILLLNIWPEPKNRKFKSLEDALWNGKLLTTEYMACAVAQIEETEDEGLHFLVTTETDETIFLSGQYLDELVQNNKFPSERFRIFKNKDSGQTYGIEPIGKPLVNWSVFDPFASPQKVSVFFLDDLEDGMLYPESINTIIDKLGFSTISEDSKTGG
jgi:hypothetical protein